MNLSNKNAYTAKVIPFLASQDEDLLSQLSSQLNFRQLELPIMNCWRHQIYDFRQTFLAFPKATLSLAFEATRICKRVDTMPLLNSLIFVLKYKFGCKACDQTYDFRKFGIGEI